ncbi:MAG: helicase [Alphaproteobacteria bacterium]|nr:helicase [Alphaproteobacteria bacterium]
MSEALAARAFIVDFLRKELVGPSPSYPAVQIDGQEILRPQDPPRQRYGAGILFPMRSQTLRQDETAEGEEVSGDAESPDPDAIVETPLADEADVEVVPGENPPDTDRDVTLANEFLPSAMGLTALVEVPDQLRIDVSASVYRHEELEWEKRKDKDGNEFSPKAWWRRPADRSIDLMSDELLGTETVVFERPVVEENERPVLALHVVSRPFPQSANPARTRLVTFTLVNRRVSESKAPDNSACFFQCGFAIREPNGRACFLGYPERPRDAKDDEELSLQLLYIHRKTFAVGHGCAAEWNEPEGDLTTLIRTEVLPTYEVKPVLPTLIEGLELRMLEFASGDSGAGITLCTRLADEYEEWISARNEEIELRVDLSGELKQTGRRHMENCRECLRRMRDGITLLSENPDVAFAFRLMNEAMLMQQVHYQISSEKIRSWISGPDGLKLEAPFARPSYDDPERKWRPFQLAFILMNIRAVLDPSCQERGIVDVIWFPTGGGKTEAYLGLSALTMFLRRLRNRRHAGTTILMRYTLRLLTTQQFQRAASLICACEMIRVRQRELLGEERFSIGLWVGGEVTPNTEENAVKALRQLQSGRGVNKFIMLSCPWCGAAMGPQQAGRSMRCKGYRKLAHPARVRLICEDPECDFSSDDGLPLAVIDEQIYDSPPTLVIGTVDKFAMLAFQPAARRLFGIDTPYPPPELIIQDELHLISGPLGSMVGHYETAIEALCVNEKEGQRDPAKIIASTATISRAESQVQGLYGRSAFLFPPQALKAGDSFFAEEREDEVGRLYVGVFATALPSHVTAQVRTMGALLQAPKLFAGSAPHSIDPYWTMMGYFNSLRELGHAATLVRADIREFLNAMWDRLGLRLEVVKDAAVDPRRFINRDVELTSRVQSSEIPGILQQLFVRYDGSTASEVIDICFATNMIQVGLDVPRLSLMTIVGQPKTTSEYIQASSRVGRDIRRPGLVVINYNPFKPRDRSHYEHFRSYHHALYQHVEPTSVTPFAVPVRERALHALIVILCRFWGDEDLRIRPNHPPDAALVRRIKQTVRERIMSVDPDEWPGTERLVDEIIGKWAAAPPPRYGGFGPPSEEIPLMYPAGGQRHPLWYDASPPYPTPTSMRNIDADCAARPLTGGYGSKALS